MDIRLDKITARYGEKDVLKNFSAVFREKQTTVVMGSSGLGKTTLLNVLMGILRPVSGTLSGMPEKISVVFQEDRLFEEFSAIENVRAVLRRKQDTSRVEDSLKEIGLADSMEMPVSKLSGGMRRRVAIVRALLADSDVLLLDEPFKGLDTETKGMVIRFLLEHAKDKTVIVVTHDEDEAKMLGGSILSLDPCVTQN